MTYDTNFDQGYLKETGKSLDMALTNPNAFFAVDTPFGIRFTRNGEFTVNDQNELTTMEGYKVVSNMESMQPCADAGRGYDNRGRHYASERCCC